MIRDPSDSYPFFFFSIDICKQQTIKAELTVTGVLDKGKDSKRQNEALNTNLRLPDRSISVLWYTDGSKGKLVLYKNIMTFCFCLLDEHSICLIVNLMN